MVFSRRPSLSSSREDGGDVLVQGMQHGGVGVLFLGGGVGFGGGQTSGDFRVHGGEVVLLCLQRCMHEVEGHVAEERARLVLANELDGMLRDEVIRVALVLRAEIEIVPPGDGAFSLHGPPREVVRAATVINPGFIEAVRVQHRDRP